VNVVIVSDEPVLAELARRPLEPLGHVVTAVASVGELERRLADLAPHAALLPRRLPDRALADTVEMLRGASAQVATIVIGTSASDRNLARDVDADGFLLVPFTDSLGHYRHGSSRSRRPIHCRN
jgi:DNA-binding response OmpR family regulator